MSDRKVTIYEIAKAAGVSIATISRAMNPQTRHKVSPQVRRVIDGVVAKYSYAPNLAAKGLSSAVFNTIGVVMPHGRGIFLNDYYTRILNGISDELLDTPYRFKLLTLKRDNTNWSIYDFRGAEGVDGLIICQWRAFFPDKSVVEKLRLPFVIIGDPEPGIESCFVSPDHEQTGEIAAEYLIRNGHRRIALMEGAMKSVDNRLRVRGFKRALARHGVEIDADGILCGDFLEDRAADAARAWLEAQKGRRYTAMFCCNDAMAFGVLQVLRESGLRCPDDLSLIGVDDLTASASCQPPLTSIRMPLSEVARMASKHLLEHLRHRTQSFAQRRILLPVELVERKSVLDLTARSAAPS